MMRVFLMAFLIAAFSVCGNAATVTIKWDETTGRDGSLSSLVPDAVAPLDNATEMPLSLSFGPTAYKHHVVPFTIRTGDDIPDLRTISSAKLLVQINSSGHLAGALDCYEYTAATVLLDPTWNEIDSVGNTNWTDKSVANTAHITTDCGSVLDSYTLTGTGSEPATFDVLASGGIPATMGASNIDIEFVMRFSGTSGTANMNTDKTTSTCYRLEIVYSGTAPTATNTPTSTSTPTPTFTPTPTNTTPPGATNTPTPTFTAVPAIRPLIRVGEADYFVPSTVARIDTANNRLGVNTTSPDADVDIESAASAVLKIQTTGTANSVQVYAEADRTTLGDALFLLSAFWNANEVGRISFDAGADTVNEDDGGIAFHTSEAGVLSERMRIEQGGEVGIGTAAPANILDVNGGIVIGSGYAGVETAPTNGLLVEGNVGVGTNAPSETLDVVGTLEVYGVAGKNLVVDPTDGAGYMRLNGTHINLNLDRGAAAQSGQIRFQLIGADKWFLGAATDSSGGDDEFFIGQTSEGTNADFWIEPNGNVGIGVTAPDTPLDVNGATTGRELNADPANPDEGSYVIWMSNGVGSGADGDIMMKITAGGVTKTKTLIVF